MDIYKNLFGKSLTSALKRKGLKSVDLVEHFKVKPSTVSRWINGKSFPEEISLARLAEYIGVSEQELAGVPPDVRANAKALAVKSPPDFAEAAAFLARYINLKPDRQALVAMLVFDDEAYLGNVSPRLVQSLEALLKG